ncbi:hypothetical protein [Acetobacter oryzifermentans]|uniref:hypothetical protein n=1 Tax=Acetobacter oryzifermentans TaxID=1633874 RepID=UPI0007B05D47|nr:hypothetical protein [Acetobacter oryzifermentans]
MDLLIAPGTVDASKADTAPATGTPGWATDGNPAQLIGRTIFPAYAYNAILAEIYNVIVGAKLTPDRTDNTQLFKAISQIAAGSESAFLPLSGGTLTGIVIGIAVSDWSQRQLVNAVDADGRYVKKSGDTSTGSQYSSGWFSGGINGGWNGARANTGDYGWTNGLEFGNPADDGKYRGTWSVADVLNDGSSNSSGLNLTGYDSAGKTYQWYFAWNGNITTPKGLVAFQSDLSGYVANTNTGISGAISGTSLCVNPSDGRAYFAYNSNAKIGTLAWYADVTAETTARVNADNNLQAQVSAKQPAGNYVTGLSAGKIMQDFVVAVEGSGVHDITFPQAFSGTPTTIVISHGLTNGSNDPVSVLSGWTATGFQIQTNGSTSVNFLAVGPA